MGLLFNLLAFPVLGPIWGVQGLAQAMVREAEQEFLDESRVRGKLSELQVRYDLGEIMEAEYLQEEEALLGWLRAIKEIKG